VTEQTTVASSSGWIAGSALDRPGECRLRFHPAGADEGIRFVRSDLPGAPEVLCGPEQLRSMPRWTLLEQAGVAVHHTEHVLAALAFCGVDNARIELDSEGVPMTDSGRCATFHAALSRLGTRALGAPRRVYALAKPLFFLDRQRTTGEESAHPELRDGRYVLGVPADHFSVSYVFHWSHLEGLPIGVAEYDEAAPDAARHVLDARSYLVETETEKVRDLLGPVRETVLMLYPRCPMELGLEAARHKIVDFVGDLRILGRPVRGRFIAFRTGHRIHHELVGHLLRDKMLQLV